MERFGTARSAEIHEFERGEQRESLSFLEAHQAIVGRVEGSGFVRIR